MKSYGLNGSLPANLFDNKAFRKGTRVERMYMHLVDPWKYQLKSHEDRYLQLCQRAFVIICENPSRREARRLILETVLEPITDSRSGNRNNVSGIQLMRDAEDLFGRFETINKKIQRGIVRERISLRLQQLYQEADEGDANDKAIAKYEELLIGLDRLNEIVDDEVADMSLPELHFTTDPAALLDAEDAEYEEE